MDRSVLDKPPKGGEIHGLYTRIVPERQRHATQARMVQRKAYVENALNTLGSDW